MRYRYISVILVFFLIVLLGLIGFNYIKNKENITDDKLIFEIKLEDIDCATVSLKVYNDYTYRYYYSNDNKEYIEGTYTYNVFDAIKTRNKNKINNDLYILIDKYGKEYKVNGLSEDLNKLLKEINIELDTCLIDIEENLGDDYLNIVYTDNYKYTHDSNKNLVYFYKYNSNNERYEKVKTYEYFENFSVVDEDNVNGKYTFNLDNNYLYVSVENDIYETFERIFPINNDKNEYNNMVVYKNKKFGIIDLTGKIIYDLEYEQIGTFNNTDRFESESYIYNEIIAGKKNDNWGIIKVSEKKVLVDYLYDNVFLINEDLYLAYNDGYLYVKSISDKSISSDKMKVNIHIKYPEVEKIEFGLENYYVAKNIGLDYKVENNIITIRLKKDYDNKENYDIYNYNIISKELIKIN